MSKESESTRTASDSSIEPFRRPRGNINRDKFSKDSIWGARIKNRNAPGSSLDDATDEDLVRALQGERRPKAHGYFMILYGRHADRVYQKCLAYSGNEADARDLTQEVFIKIYTGLSSFRFQSAVSTWVHRMRQITV